WSASKRGAVPKGGACFWVVASGDALTRGAAWLGRGSDTPALQARQVAVLAIAGMKMSQTLIQGAVRNLPFPGCAECSGIRLMASGLQNRDPSPNLGKPKVHHSAPKR